MRENCLSGSEGGGPDRPVRPPYPYQRPAVTPAKAGVQWFVVWIPAGAGMTASPNLLGDCARAQSGEAAAR